MATIIPAANEKAEYQLHNDRMYVADYGNHCIPVFEFCLTIGSGQVGGPLDIAISSSNHLLVDPCVYTFTLDGE